MDEVLPFDEKAKEALDEAAEERSKRDLGGKHGYPWTKNTNQKRNKNRHRMARESRRRNRRQ